MENETTTTEEKLVHREWFTESQLITLKWAMRNYIHSGEAMTLGENEVYFLATKIQEYEQVLAKLREERRVQNTPLELLDLKDKTNKITQEINQTLNEIVFEEQN